MGLQVIERERIDHSGATQATSALAEEMRFKKELAYKQALLNYQIQQLKIQERNATTDEEKLRLQQREGQVKGFSDLVGQAQKMGNKDDAVKFIMQGLFMYPSMADIFKDESQLRDLAGGTSPEQDVQKYAAELMRRNLGGATPQDQLVPSSVTLGGEGAAGDPEMQQQARAQAVGQSPEQPSLVSPEFNIRLGSTGSMKFVNPEQSSQLKYNEVMTTERAKRDVETAGVRRSYDELKRTFLDAATEMGGLGEGPLQALAKGSISQFLSSYGTTTMPNTQGFYKLLNGFGLQLASQLNRGRPSDKDFEAAVALVMSPKYPMATNAVLMRYVEGMLSQSDPNTSRRMQDKLYDSMVEVRRPTASDKELLEDLKLKFPGVSDEEARGLILERKLSRGGV